MLVIVYRTVIVYLVIVGTMRLMGKRQLGQLELSELVVAVLVSDLAAMPLADTNTSLLRGLVPVFVLFICELLISSLSLKSIRFRSLICGRPSIIIDNGKLIQSELKRNRLSLDELTEALRKNGILNLADTQYAILETDGTLSAVAFADKQPLTASQAGISVKDDTLSLPCISDGRLLTANIGKLGHDEAWVMTELKKYGVKSPSDVYIMMADEESCVYFVKKESRNLRN